MDVHEITLLEGDLGDLLRKTYVNDGREYIKVNGYVLPERYKQIADDIENFEVRDDDVWVCAFPKTGTTWTQEMVWSIANDLDFERGKVQITERFPYFENSILATPAEIARHDAGIDRSNCSVDSINYLKNMPSPRFIKTHLPINLLPRQLRMGEKKPKVVYTVRNAKDTCISGYHFRQLIHGFEGSFEDFAALLLGDTVMYAPFLQHVLGYWNKRNDHNMLFLKYEDMKMDLPSVIKKTAAFLGKSLTNDQVSSLTDHLSFSNMKANPAVNYEGFMSRMHNALRVKREGAFIRSGTSGQWKTVMSPELIKRFDDWAEEHLGGTGLSL